MAGNNSCGSRSIRYGNMVHNVLAIDARARRRLASSASARATQVAAGPVGYRALAAKLHAIVRARGRRDRGAVAEGAAPRAGLQPRHGAARTCRTTWRICWSARRARSRTRSACTLKLSPLPKHKTLGVCHFPTFYRAMESAQHIVKLEPGRGRAGRPHDDRARARQPGVRADGRASSCAASRTAILLVEFAGDAARRAGGQARAAGRADGRPRTSRAAWSRSPTRRCRTTCGKCARRASTS